MECKGGLEKAILSNRTLLNELNDTFCQTHPWLAQKVTPRSVHAGLVEGNRFFFGGGGGGGGGG